MPSQTSQTTNKHLPLSRRFRRRKTIARCWLGWIAAVLASFCLLNSLSDRDAVAQDTVIAEPDSKPLSELAAGPEHWTSPEGLSSAIQVMLLLTVISMAPAVLLMTTSFVRIVVVLGLLRQAMGTQQLPPAQVITSIAMFLSLLIMTPVWKQVYSDSISPYTNGQVNPETGQKMKLFASVNSVTGEQGPDEAWERGIRPIRDFMSQQIERAGNSDDVWLLLEYLPESERKAEEAYEDYDDVPLQVLLPAFILSELKISFLIGFQVYLPFLILDVVIASVTISMGMLMLPPMLISLPFKLLLFVLVDGWHLVVQMLLDSFQPFT
jgi:flagellar biosynthetic protein FliP